MKSVSREWTMKEIELKFLRTTQKWFIQQIFNNFNEHSIENCFHFYHPDNIKFLMSLPHNTSH